MKNLIYVGLLCLSSGISAQNIGLLTQSPQAPVHIASSGQVNTPGGLLLLGDRLEGHLEMDFNLLQSRYGATSTLPLLLQPIGGKVGINTSFPQAPLHIESSGQVNTPGGLLLLGHTLEGHMEIDFDVVQSMYGAASYLPLRIQPLGGNLNIGNGLIFANRAAGFVGINTLNPDTELQVFGEMRMTTAGLATTQKDKIAIHGQLEEPASLSIGWLKNAAGIGGLQDGTSDRSAMIDIYELYYRSEGAHRWFINSVANLTTPEMVLTETGGLGIGPANPESRLHITGGTNISLTGGGYAQFGSTTGANLAFDINDIQARSNGAAARLQIQSFGGDLGLANLTDSKVGIGTNVPESKLHLLDGVDASYAQHGYFMIGTSTGANIVFDDNEILARSNGNESNLFMQRDGGHLLLCGLKSGQVAIGIDNVNNLPSADYLLAVDGKIISEEMRVQLVEDWPDYVFHDDYALRPLDVLAQEISALGHLPGMPAAVDVERDGFELGDMQRRLLEKVEELTLYVIQLNSRNEILEKEIALLKLQNNK